MACYEREVKEKLGETNYKSILRAVREYKIDGESVTKFAQYLADFHEGSKIFGDHMRRKARGGECDENEMRQILSDSYCEFMCDIPGETAVNILRLLFKDILNVPDVFKTKAPEIKESSINQATKINQSTKEQDNGDFLNSQIRDDDSCPSEASRYPTTPRKKRSYTLNIDGATTTDTEEFYMSSSSDLTINLIVSTETTGAKAPSATKFPEHQHTSNRRTENIRQAAADPNWAEQVPNTQHPQPSLPQHPENKFYEELKQKGGLGFGVNEEENRRDKKSAKVVKNIERVRQRKEELPGHQYTSNRHTEDVSQDDLPGKQKQQPLGVPATGRKKRRAPQVPPQVSPQVPPQVPPQGRVSVPAQTSSYASNTIHSTVPPASQRARPSCGSTYPANYHYQQSSSTLPSSTPFTSPSGDNLPALLCTANRFWQDVKQFCRDRDPNRVLISVILLCLALTSMIILAILYAVNIINF